jgi:hypothetical protein
MVLDAGRTHNLAHNTCPWRDGAFPEYRTYKGDHLKCQRNPRITSKIIRISTTRARPPSTIMRGNSDLKRVGPFTWLHS